MFHFYYLLPSKSDPKYLVSCLVKLQNSKNFFGHFPNIVQYVAMIDCKPCRRPKAATVVQVAACLHATPVCFIDIQTQITEVLLASIKIQEYYPKNLVLCLVKLQNSKKFFGHFLNIVQYVAIIGCKLCRRRKPTTVVQVEFCSHATPVCLINI